VRLLAAVTTPFRADGELDLDAFGAHLEWLAEVGLDGVFVGGTTGEGILLADDELAALVERAAAVGGLQVIGQAGRVSTRATVGLVRRTLAAGAHGVAAYVPWFYPLDDAGARAHFLAVLEAAGGAPAYLYNIPPRTVNDLAPALAGELAAAGFAGMKDSTGDLARHREYLAATDGLDFEVYTGTEPLLVESVRAGATGTINGLSNARPEWFVELRDSFDARAERITADLSALKREIAAEGSTVAGVKRRVAERLAERGVAYPTAVRAPFG
jgi:dihydrodipicolinate synthase/N-acetylneuraminate lyase